MPSLHLHIHPHRLQLRGPEPLLYDLWLALGDAITGAKRRGRRGCFEVLREEDAGGGLPKVIGAGVRVQVECRRLGTRQRL